MNIEAYPPNARVESESDSEIDSIELQPFSRPSDHVIIDMGLDEDQEETQFSNPVTPVTQTSKDADNTNNECPKVS